MASNIPALPPGFYANPDDAEAARIAGGGNQTLLPGWSGDAVPQTTAPVPPPPGPPADTPPLPAGHYASPKEAQDAADAEKARQQQLSQPPQPAWRGSMLPVSQDAQGNTTLDWHSGLPGAFLNTGNTVSNILGMVPQAAEGLYKSAVSTANLPGDVFYGKEQTPYSGGGSMGDYSPSLLPRTADMAQLVTPQGAAYRAGATTPGTFWRYGQPSAQELKRAADTGYAQVRASGLDFSPEAVTNAARGIQHNLVTDGAYIPMVAPQTHALLDQVADPANGLSGIASIQAVRSRLRDVSMQTADGKTTPDAAAAGMAVRRIDHYLANATPAELSPTSTFAGNPQDVAATLRQAGQNYGAAMRSNDITGSLDAATTGIGERALMRAQATHSGQNIDNSIRGKVLSFIQNPENVAGLTPGQIQMLNNVVTGTPLQNAARYTGKLLGGGGGMHGALAMAGGAAAGGVADEGGLMAILAGGIGLPSIGGTATHYANSASQRALSRVDEAIRSTSPLARQQAVQGLLPTVQYPAASTAVWRAIIPGLLEHPELLPAPRGPHPLTEAELKNQA